MLPPLFQQIDLQCTGDQLHEFLHQIQQRSQEAERSINRSGSKDDQVQNLKSAVDARFVELPEVLDFLRKCEECGRQTIFLLEPKNDEVKNRLQDATTIATELFGEEWGPDYFPIHERPVEGIQWVDCRVKIPGHPRDWCLKAYGHEVIEETIENKREEIDERHFRDIRDVEILDVNTVAVVRWRDPHFLEVRVDKLRSSGFNEMRNRLASIGQMLSPAINIQTECVSYSLQDSLRRLIDGRRAQAADKTVYRVTSIKFLDRREGSNELRPMMAGEDVDSDVGRTESIEALMKNGAKPSRVALEWLDGEWAPDSLPDSLSTTVEGDSCDAVSIASRVTPEVLDYVINKLR
ncbi:hypothetical protein RBSH_02332 [Rhodopirellula baltica SH28]|uniref:Uncharacterized protein n=1 Tax=Rhodopirellula baltica SH28 TaxID=993517 RepID=K5E937_RHOBT|nr:hypothetical protein [Rhodopirellula baltica]EKK02296.1 hypothetical protein RBSH_02332 [Rhodopirellula baltica SH28]